jgi:radical SAM superfamily enzyme YgiQ (UPF0313 family)
VGVGSNGQKSATHTVLNGSAMPSDAATNSECKGIGPFNRDRPLNIALVHVPPANSLCHDAEPLGLMALKGQILRAREDARVSILDGQIENPDSIADQLLSQSPDVIGISLFPGSRRATDAVFARFMAGRMKPPLIVFGNVGATFAFEDLLQDYPGSLAVRGEGEDAMQGIIEALYRIRPLDAVPNIVRLEDGGFIHHVRQRVDLDTVAPPCRCDSAHYIRLGIQNLIETGRGCRHGCAFCTRGIFFNEHRRREFPVDRIVRDLEALSSLGAGGVTIADDDCFQAGPAKVMQMAQHIIEAKSQGRIAGNLQLAASLRADELWSGKASEEENRLKRQALELMHRAGLVWISMGIESGSPTQLQRYGKTVTPSDTRSALVMLESLGIGIEASIMPFDPQVSFPELRETMAFLRQTGLWKHVVEPFSVVRAVAGSALTERLQSCGLVDRGYDRDWQMYRFRFQDERIALVVQLLYAWRQPFHELNAALKRAYREEMWCGHHHDPGAQRIFHYAVLSRAVFLDMLERCVEIVEHGKGAYECRAAFSAGNRDLKAIAASLLDEIDKGIITDRTGLLKAHGAEFIEKCPITIRSAVP